MWHYLGNTRSSRFGVKSVNYRVALYLLEKRLSLLAYRYAYGGLK